MKGLRKKLWTEYIPLAVTFIGIVICAIVFKQDFIKTFPVCFSLVIVLLNSRANRIGFLLGAINACIYSVGYFMEGLYGTTVSACVSMVLQTTTFFAWKKRAYNQATEFRKLKNTSRILLAVGIIAAWSITSFILFKVGGREVVLDGLVLILGFVLPIMQLFALIDSLPLHLLNVVISLVMWLRIIVFDGVIANTTYLISSVFGLYMAIRMTIKWLALYKEQQNNKRSKA